jgi:hypothetical protein
MFTHVTLTGKSIENSFSKRSARSNVYAHSEIE